MPDLPQEIVATGIYGLEIIPRMAAFLWILGPSTVCESLDRCVEYYEVGRKSLRIRDT